MLLRATAAMCPMTKTFQTEKIVIEMLQSNNKYNDVTHRIIIKLQHTLTNNIQSPYV